MTGCISSCKFSIVEFYEHVTNDAYIKSGGNYADDTTVLFGCEACRKTYF